jgi:predicted nucleotidyltransferase
VRQHDEDRRPLEGAELREAVPAVVADIVAAARPVKVILFGSVARGEEGPDSDLDFLVVLDDLDPGQRARLMGRIRFAINVLAPIDIYVTDLEEFDRRKDVNGSMLYWPAREGQVVYERDAA